MVPRNHRRRPRSVAQLSAGLASCALLAAGAARAQSAPSEEMLAPVHSLVAFMSTLPAGKHANVFSRRGPCIVENFAPFLFCGPGAELGWERGLRAHFAEDALTDLAAAFGETQDFSQSGRRAYFSLPTTWTGRTHGRRFEEHGAWAFILERGAEGWRIKSYGWAVTAYSEPSS